MSLQSQLAAFITAIGADIKSLRNSEAHNGSTANQTLTNGVTYLAGSNVLIPTGKIKVGTKYRCKFNVVKTAAGTAAPVITIKVGSAGTTADTTRVTLTQTVQTAVIDEGVFEIECVFRVAGASAILNAITSLGHRLAVTGLTTSNHSIIQALSAAFDVTPANQQIGVAIDVGASSSWTVHLVTAELFNLAV